MKINLKGVTRIILEFKTYVIKIPNFTYSWDHFLKGIVSNIEEGRTWRYNSGRYESGHSYLLCPVQWTSWGGWLLIMKKARTLTQQQWDAMPYSNYEHMLHFRGNDSLNNYGIYHGRLVKIDYGELNDNWGEDFKNKAVH